MSTIPEILKEVGERPGCYNIERASSGMIETLVVGGFHRYEKRAIRPYLLNSFLAVEDVFANDWGVRSVDPMPLYLKETPQKSQNA